MKNTQLNETIDEIFGIQHMNLENKEKSEILTKESAYAQYCILYEEKKLIEEKMKALKTVVLSGVDLKEGTNKVFIGEEEINVKMPIARKVDGDLLKNEFKNLPESVRVAFRWKAEVDLPIYRKLENQDKLIADNFITSKPNSPSIEMKGGDNE